jgi:hypothetical protein
MVQTHTPCHQAFSSTFQKTKLRSAWQPLNGPTIDTGSIVNLLDGLKATATKHTHDMSPLPDTPNKPVVHEILSNRFLFDWFGFVASVPFFRPSDELILVCTVALLYLTHELVVVAFDLHEIIVRQFPPLAFELSLKLTPLPIEGIGVHGFLLVLVHVCTDGVLV